MCQFDTVAPDAQKCAISGLFLTFCPKATRKRGLKQHMTAQKRISVSSTKSVRTPLESTLCIEVPIYG
jgi:hypothetical protein